MISDWTNCGCGNSHRKVARERRRPKRKEAASRRRDSMSETRQNNQLRLAFSEVGRSEAPKVLAEGPKRSRRSA
jgi:hypothetical protein